jgi:hypothetical protein
MVCSEAFEGIDTGDYGFSGLLFFLEIMISQDLKNARA